MPKGEIQNRDRDESADLQGIPLVGLGELPEDIADERGDLSTYSRDSRNTRVPDMVRAAESRVQEKLTGLGAPFMDYTVRSVYDARPPSGRDFNLWFYSQLTSAHFDRDFTGFRRCFRVPTGWVAVIRAVKFQVTPQSSMTSSDIGPQALYSAYTDLIARILVNGASADPETPEGGQATGTEEPVYMGGISVRDGDSVDTFVIADENQFVGVEIVDWLEVGDGIGPKVNVGFYGQYLLKTGRPAMFEPSNLAGRSNNAVVSTPGDMTNAWGGDAEVTTRRRRRVPFGNVPILRKP
jgi:hypothetical protein